MKNCPFCDGKAHLWERKCDKTKYTIGCDNIECFLWIPKDVRLRELHNYAMCYADKADAIEAWNTRYNADRKMLDKKKIESVLAILTDRFHEHSDGLVSGKLFRKEIAIVIYQHFQLFEIKLPEKKEEFETCTRCGGIGRRPNHPHIIAQTCERCDGRGKVDRKDYKIRNETIDECAKMNGVKS